MPGKVAEPSRPVPLVATATGETVHVWAVDAREMLANGDYVTPEAYAAGVDSAAVTDGGETGESAVAVVEAGGPVAEPTRRKR